MFSQNTQKASSLKFVEITGCNSQKLGVDIWSPYYNKRYYFQYYIIINENI